MGGIQYVQKHLANKHQEEVGKVREKAESEIYWDNFIMDSNRPKEIAITSSKEKTKASSSNRGYDRRKFSQRKKRRRSFRDYTPENRSSNERWHSRSPQRRKFQNEFNRR